MKIRDLLNKLEGIQTIETVMDALEVDRKKAVYYVYRLRKKGYVKTKSLKGNKRMYNISFENRLKGFSYYDIINKHAPFKITISNIDKIYGTEPTYEETLIFAIKTQSFRTILASLALFRRIEDWSLLFQLAKTNRIERQIGALYDVVRKTMLTKRMSNRFRKHSLPKEKSVWGFIVPKMKSDNFKDIEKEWKIYIPFNKKDLEVYK